MMLRQKALLNISRAEVYDKDDKQGGGDGCSRIKMINRAAEWLLRDKIIKRAEDVPRLWT